MVLLSVLALAAIPSGAPQSVAVSVGTLLPEMTDLRHLTMRPRPYYTTAQSSSYDRKSDPGPGSDPFANADAGKYLRVEKTANGNEYVMADLKGPGALVRIWSANPVGTIRFYFDGEAQPRFQAKMVDLLSGKVEPFVSPFAYGAAQGFNFYFPMPYAKSLKVTADESGGEGVKALYYHVGYRTYAPGQANVSTFSMADLERNRASMISVRTKLEHPDTIVPKNLDRVSYGPFRYTAGQARYMAFDQPGVVRQLEIKIPFPLIQTIRPLEWNDPYQPHNVLRKVLLTMDVDGKRVVSTPVGDFFGTAGGVNPYRTLPFEVQQDGTMICRLPLPYHKSLRIGLHNTGLVEVPISMAVMRDPKAPAPSSYALHAEWGADKGSSRPMRDMNFLTTRGEGMWVGSNLHVSNPTPAWWGEGDEKVYVDGEKFPSTFGTGTEDYYGYAWCSPILFERPYHSQPRCDGPGNFGHTNVNRWHVLDPIPYRRSMKFDMEMWHWAEVDVVFAFTSFWYAPPGSKEPRAIDHTLLLPIELKPPAPVPGALEGEKLVIATNTGGTTENQGGFWELSSGQQLWWKDVQAGQKLVLEIPVAEAGKYEIVGNFCHARDYGIHRLSVNGVEAKTLDFYGNGVTWKKISLGTFDLPAGTARLEVECVGNREGAIPSRMFGLDYLLLEKR